VQQRGIDMFFSSSSFSFVFGVFVLGAFVLYLCVSVLVCTIRYFQKKILAAAGTTAADNAQWQ
jgi:hypothetical protein